VALDAAMQDRVAPPTDGGVCSQYEGSSAWTASLVVEPDARLCAYAARQWSSNAGETQEQMKQRLVRAGFEGKSTIAVAAGRYPLPTSSESRAFLLPMCVEDRGGVVGPASAATSVTVSEGSGIGATPGGTNVEGSFALGAEPLQLRINRPASVGAVASLPAQQSEHYRGVNLTRGERLYANCALVANRCTTLALGAMGTLRMDEHYWQAMPGLGFSTPVRLRGTLSATPIDITLYRDMVGIYARHAFERVNVFRFSAPINGACAIRVDVSDLGDPTVVSLTDCDGAPMGAALPVTASEASCT
jgi:hypothetical protein